MKEKKKADAVLEVLLHFTGDAFQVTFIGIWDAAWVRLYNACTKYSQSFSLWASGQNRESLRWLIVEEILCCTIKFLASEI